MSQIADKKLPCMILQGGLSVNLNHLKTITGAEMPHISVKLFLMGHYMSRAWVGRSKLVWVVNLIIV